MSKPKIPANPILSARIRETRLQIKYGRKMTQFELAEKIGVDEQTIRKYEKGKAGIPKAAVQAIARVFGCCTEYLYGETNCYAIAEYETEQSDTNNLISHAVAVQEKVQGLWDVTVKFFQEFLHYKIHNTYIREDNGSILPVVLIEGPKGNRYSFSSRRDAEAFLLSYYEDAAKLLKYHLLDHADSQTQAAKTATKPTPTP